jgi:hypothetical protein
MGAYQRYAVGRRAVHELALVTICESGFILCTFFCRNLSPCLESPKPPSLCSSPPSLVCRPLSRADLLLKVPPHSSYPSTTLSHDNCGLLTAAMHLSTTFPTLPFPLWHITKHLLCSKSLHAALYLNPRALPHLLSVLVGQQVAGRCAGPGMLVPRARSEHDVDMGHCGHARVSDLVAQTSQGPLSPLFAPALLQSAYPLSPYFALCCEACSAPCARN